VKFILILCAFLNIVHASSESLYQTSLYTGTLFFFLLLAIIALILYKKHSKDQKLLEEKEEKITWLRQVHAENEHRYLKKEQETETEILSLKHTISDLERKLQEGTKNQVVAKIEALQKKRQNKQNSASHS